MSGPAGALLTAPRGAAGGAPLALFVSLVSAMVSPISAASAAAQAAAFRLRRETVTFARGASSVTVQAVRGQRSWERSQPSGGVSIGDRSEDWIILAADLVISAAVVTPQRGDTITAGSTVFRVMPFGTNDQLWQYHDRDRLYLRIHTKERT